MTGTKKIFFPIGDASEALDTFYAYYRLPEDDYEVVDEDVVFDAYL